VVRLVDDELVDLAFDDADGAGKQLAPFDDSEYAGWGEVDEVVGPLANDLRVPDGARGAADDAQLLVADLVAVAVGAVQHVTCPPLCQPRDVGQLVAQAGGDQQTSGRDPLPAVEENPEPGPAIGHQVGDRAGDDLAAVTGDLVPAGGKELSWGQAVAGQIAVHMGGGGVAWLAGIDHEDLPAGSGQDQGCGQAGGASADDHYVVSVHGPRLAPAAVNTNQRCCLRETGVR
jgi:hypothetical protein